MKRNLLLSFALITLFSFSVIAQITVSGKVTDESGEGLPGVNVVIKGTTTGVSTDLDGNYQISVDSDASLIFSYVGFETQEVTVGSRTTIDVTMGGAVQLEEVVVTGQGAGISKNRIATTVDVVSAKDLENKPLTRIDQVIQSALPSSQILMSSGDPGTASIVRSRGIASAALSTTPIIYIDGVRVDNLNTGTSLGIATGGAQSSALADIPVEAIERIEFVKGGAATTLFGADAGNGVIQIFTKKGQAGKARFTFETQLGAIKGTGDYFKYDATSDIVFKTGFSQTYRIGASGGNENVTYNFTGSINGDNGYREGIENQRYSLRTTINASLNEKLNLQSSLGFVSNNFTRLPNANSSFDRAYGIEQGLSTGTFGLSTNNPDEWTPADVAIVSQLLSDVARTADITENVKRFQNSQSLTYDPIDKVSIKATFGVDYRYSKQQAINTNEYLIVQQSEAPGTTDQGTIAVTERNFLSSTGSLNIQYEETYNDFSFITIAGGQFFRNDDRQTRLDATNVVEGSKSVNNSSEVIGQDFIQTVTNYGFFGKENVGFKDRYFVDFGFRVDYNTAFGTDVGGQFFPSFGASYVVSNEAFFDGLSSVVSFMKLRGTYGEAGNFPAPFARAANLEVNSFLGGTAVQPFVPAAPNLAPERVKTTEFGVDLRFLDDRFSLAVTYFDSKTEDALFTAPFAPSFGLAARQRNLGTISNKGWEIVSTFNIVRNADWDVNLTASLNKIENKVESTGGAAEFNIGGFTFLGPFVTEGLPLGYLRGAQPTFDESGALASVERNTDLGKTLPDYFGSMTLSATFKQRWSLFVTGDWQTGGYSVNTNEVLRFFRGLDDDRVPAASSSVSFFDLGGVWVESSDYLKIRNISLSYSMPNEWFNDHVKNVQVTFTALNPLNFFKATNFDPETTGAGARTQNAVNVGGFGYGTFSAPRQFIGSIKFNF
ncbi:MAG: TonB-dependent receptor [Ekhidna sp.]